MQRRKRNRVRAALRMDTSFSNRTAGLNVRQPGRDARSPFPIFPRHKNVPMAYDMVTSLRLKQHLVAFSSAHKFSEWHSRRLLRLISGWSRVRLPSGKQRHWLPVAQSGRAPLNSVRAFSLGFKLSSSTVVGYFIRNRVSEVRFLLRRDYRRRIAQLVEQWYRNTVRAFSLDIKFWSGTGQGYFVSSTLIRPTYRRAVADWSLFPRRLSLWILNFLLTAGPAWWHRCRILRNQNTPEPLFPSHLFSQGLAAQ